MGKTTTLENIITLTALAFAEQEVTAKDVASFLGVTTRQARTILYTMVKFGYAENTARGKYYIHLLPGKAITVIKSILYMLYKKFETLEEGK